MAAGSDVFAAAGSGGKAPGHMQTHPGDGVLPYMERAGEGRPGGPRALAPNAAPAWSGEAENPSGTALPGAH